MLTIAFSAENSHNKTKYVDEATSGKNFHSNIMIPSNVREICMHN